MTYDFTIINYVRLKELIQQAGLSDREFCKQLWGDDTHTTIQYFIDKPNIRVNSLVRIAEILHCPMDKIFQKSDTNGTVPAIEGDKNNVNSNNIRIEINSLKAENQALKMVIDEKNERIAELKKLAEQLERHLNYVLAQDERKV